MTTVVLDASAVLAFLKNEPGAEVVLARLGQAVISAVNLQEVVKEMVLDGLSRDVIETIIEELHLEVHDHDGAAAFSAAALVTDTRRHGSGLGDRSCMALGIALGAPVLTTDRAWTKVVVDGLQVELVR